MFEFRSHAFGVVSVHALVSFLFQRTHKKAEKEKPTDEDLVDSTGLMENSPLLHYSESVDSRLRRVYWNLTCTILFVGLRMPSQQLLKHAFGYTVTTAKTYAVGESDFFHQQLEARNTQTTVTLCEW